MACIDAAAVVRREWSGPERTGISLSRHPDWIDGLMTESLVRANSSRNVASAIRLLLSRSIGMSRDG